ncbi:hypothetical protein [Actinomadura formosensis]|uniref:hypothetical protein n=1 Tax=Actinomadura formosensis TaxID=60706 RepID=UPI000831C2BB|nr:hypothetical protein [Actinomadura formosensis]
MGENHLDVEPRTIKRAGAGINSSAQHLQTEWEQFQAKLQGHGEPWGQDMLGMLIGGCYMAVYELAAECIQENIAGLKGHAEGATVMAANYFQAEDASTVEVNRVRDILG